MLLSCSSVQNKTVMNMFLWIRISLWDILIHKNIFFLLAPGLLIQGLPIRAEADISASWTLCIDSVCDPWASTLKKNSSQVFKIFKICRKWKKEEVCRELLVWELSRHKSSNVLHPECVKSAVRHHSQLSGGDI